MHHPMLRKLSGTILLLFCGLAVASSGQEPRALVAPTLDENQRAPLSRQAHPLAQPQFEQGVAPDELPLRRMLLVLARPAEQQAALQQWLSEQQTPSSPNYRRWLTPAEFGERFGANEGDLRTLTGWLELRGFTVENVASARNLIEISGTATQFQGAFHASLRRYAAGGQSYWANAEAPTIPAALAPLVRGFASLNNFPRKRLARPSRLFLRGEDGSVTPAYTVVSGSQTYYAIGPADFATIYNTAPLLQSGITGTGQTIAVIGRSNVNVSDIADFRALFALGAGDTSVIIDGADPGIVSGDEDESVLDLEWASAVAPGATVALVSAADTATTSGLDLAAAYVIEHNLATVISESYGLCEAYLGDAGNSFMEELWQQAAAQGISVTVAAGDSGSALCDNPNSAGLAQGGLAVNGVASTSYNVAVGGTDFDDAGIQSTYWNLQNAATTRASVLSYIPETTWNESCAASATAASLNVCPAASNGSATALNLWAGSGGASGCVITSISGDTVICQKGRAKPGWQTGSGVPPDGVRDMPDVSLFAAANSDSKSFYIVCQADRLPSGYSSCKISASGIYMSGTGGTSVGAPSFAGIIALAAQKAGTRLGNVNALLYPLAAGTGSSCTSAPTFGASCLFHDIVKGNISVPCVAGSPACSLSAGTSTGVLVNAARHPAYEAGTGYDLATGLGSVNASALAAALAAPTSLAPTTTSLTLNGATGSLTARHGDALQINVGVSPSTSSGTVALSGSNGTITSSTLISGAAAWSSRLFPGGGYTVTAHYAGDSTHAASSSNSIVVTVNPEPSRTLVNLVALDLTGAPLTYGNSSLAYGSDYLVRVDVGDALMAGSSSQAPTSTCSHGAASCPTGSASVTANGSALGPGSLALTNGNAETASLQLPAGSYHIAAAYGGDLSYAASSGSLDFVIAKASTTVTAYTSSPTTAQYGVPLSITAQLATNSYGASPAGTVTLLDNGAAVGIGLQSITQLSSPGLAPQYAALSYSSQYISSSLGPHALSASYSGDSNYSGTVSAPVSFTVVPATTSLSSGTTLATAVPAAEATLTAVVSSVSALEQPTGAVWFYENGNLLSGTVSYGGNAGPNASLTASLTTSFTQIGNHAITASYGGDAHYKAATQALGTLLIQKPFGLSLPVAQVQSNGGASSALLNVANTTGSPLAITLACTSDSPHASCSVSPASVTLAAGSSTTASVVYTVPALSAASVFHLGPIALVLVMFALIVGRCTKSVPRQIILPLLMVALLFAAGCGGGGSGQQASYSNNSSGSSGSTSTFASAQTYTFTVSGSGGAYADSQTLTVTVR